MPGLPYYKIINVQEGSPGDLAGLLPDDVIVYINHTSAKDITLSEINQLLMSREDRNIKMQVKRNGQLVTADFRLQKVF
jgi:C-terminal processing protease CtpA/Prc